MADTGRVALVTGAAGDIGQALCARLAATGLRVVGWDAAAQPLTAVAMTAWETVDLAAEQLPADLTRGLADAGPLVAVFHVVGGADADELGNPDPVRVPMNVFRRVVGVNLFSAYAVISSTVELMRAATGDRSYTVVSSINAYGGYGSPGYSAAKAGLHGLVRTLAVPLAADRIRINGVALGTTRTANFARLEHQLGRTTDFESLGRLTPRGSVLDPAEAAAAITAIGLNNTAVSGTVVTADGAQSLARP